MIHYCNSIIYQTIGLEFRSIITVNMYVMCTLIVSPPLRAPWGSGVGAPGGVPW